jgi:hypothetical protein
MQSTTNINLRCLCPFKIENLHICLFLGIEHLDFYHILRRDIFQVIYLIFTIIYSKDKLQLPNIVWKGKITIYNKGILTYYYQWVKLKLLQVQEWNRQFNLFLDRLLDFLSKIKSAQKASYHIYSQSNMSLSSYNQIHILLKQTVCFWQLEWE